VANPVWNHEATFDVHQVDSHVTISVWDRIGESEEETFLGHVRASPARVAGRTDDVWYPLMQRDGSLPTGGEIRVQFTFKPVAVVGSRVFVFHQPARSYASNH